MLKLVLVLVLFLAAPAVAQADQIEADPPERPAGAERVALATGDSMMQSIEVALDRRLEALGLPTVADSRIGTGISKPFLLDWVKYGDEQATKVQPEVVIAFLGANDLHPIGGRDCCGRRWSDGYAKRVQTIVRRWLRDGGARVYWLALPTPRDRGLARVFRAVNRGARRGVAAAGGRFLELGDVISPGDRYRATQARGARRVRVRLPDGVHLAPYGATIAARVVVDALRADGVLR